MIIMIIIMFDHFKVWQTVNSHWHYIVVD